MATKVLLFSGGLDSTTALYLLRRDGDDVVPLFISYGQRHLAREQGAAEEICGQLGIRSVYAELDGVNRLWRPNALTSRQHLLPEAGISPGDTVVPGRNLLMLSVANLLAEQKGSESIAIGCNADDAEVYVDCRYEFLCAARTALGRRVEAPLVHLTKAEVAKLAVKLGVPIERTWSCYAGGPAQCGRCDACVRRAVALEETDRSPFGTRVGGDDAAR